MCIYAHKGLTLNKSLFFSTFFTKNATGDLQLKDHKSQDMDLGFWKAYKMW